MYKWPFHKRKRSYRNLGIKAIRYKTTITLCSNFSGSPSTVWIASSTSSSVFRNSCEWTTNWSCFLSLHLPPYDYLMYDIVCWFYRIHQQWSEQTQLRTTSTSATSSSIPSRGTSTTWRTSSSFAKDALSSSNSCFIILYRLIQIHKATGIEFFLRNVVQCLYITLSSYIDLLR